MAQHHDGVAHGTPDDQYLETPPGAGYEHTDAHVRSIAKFMFWLLVSAGIIYVLMWGMWVVFVAQRQETAEAAFPLATGQENRLPAEPRLQRFPANEAYEFRLQEDAAMQSYGWVDRQAGTVQIPIAEAMRLTVERGLPARAPAVDADATGLIPADSSSGRTMEKRR